LSEEKKRKKKNTIFEQSFGQVIVHHTILPHEFISSIAGKHACQKKKKKIKKYNI
jgi:hypothetical protein